MRSMSASTESPVLPMVSSSGAVVGSGVRGESVGLSVASRENPTRCASPRVSVTSTERTPAPGGQVGFGREIWRDLKIEGTPHDYGA